MTELHPNYRELQEISERIDAFSYLNREQSTDPNKYVETELKKVDTRNRMRTAAKDNSEFEANQLRIAETIKKFCKKNGKEK